jgi:hypothetical protein
MVSVDAHRVGTQSPNFYTHTAVTRHQASEGPWWRLDFHHCPLSVEATEGSSKAFLVLPARVLLANA